jgi:hypothetical protein
MGHDIDGDGKTFELNHLLTREERKLFSREERRALRRSRRIDLKEARAEARRRRLADDKINTVPEFFVALMRLLGGAVFDKDAFLALVRAESREILSDLADLDEVPLTAEELEAELVPLVADWLDATIDPGELLAPWLGDGFAALIERADDLAWEACARALVRPAVAELYEDLESPASA